MQDYIERSLEPVLGKAASEFPAVILTGPRQSGKTTLLKRLFGDRFGYVSFETPDVRSLAVGNLRGFLKAYPVIFDEVQHVPDLLSYIKERTDENHREAGQYLLTGSHNLALAEKVNESLAGRAAILRLLPLSGKEARGKPQAAFPWERERRPNRPVADDPWNGFLRG